MIISASVPDSTVYVHLKELREPAIADAEREVSAVALGPGGAADLQPRSTGGAGGGGDGQADFTTAWSLFEAAHR